MRSVIVISMIVLVSGCRNEDSALVAACSTAVESMQPQLIGAKCDSLSMEQQRTAAEIATKSSGVIVFLPPYETKKANAETSAQGQKAPVYPPVAVKEHNYVMRDGMRYGYPMAISETARKAGQTSEKLVMAFYAGNRGEKHQAHIYDGKAITVLECGVPCDYLKIMTFMNIEEGDQDIRVEHMAANPESIGSQIMQDAISGKLEVYAVFRGKNRYTSWVDEQKGIIHSPIAAKK